MKKVWAAICVLAAVAVLTACRYYTPEQNPNVCVSMGDTSVMVDVSALGDDMPIERVLQQAQVSVGADDMLWCISRGGTCVAMNAAVCADCRVLLANDVVSVCAADSLALNDADNIHLPLRSVEELVVWSAESGRLTLLYDGVPLALTDAAILLRLGFLRQIGEVVTYNRYRAVGYELYSLSAADLVKDGYALRIVLRDGSVLPIERSASTRCYWYHGGLRIEGYTECVAQIQYVSV